MKRFSKFVSAILLLMQGFLAIPFHALADEMLTKESTEQVQQTTETTDSDAVIESSESSTTISSESSTTASSESSTTSASNTTSSSEVIKPSQAGPSKKEEETQLDANPKEPKPETPKAEEQEFIASVSPQPVQTPNIELHSNQVVGLSGIGVLENGSIHFEKDESVDSFIRKIGESARKIGQEHDLYASVMIAQAILESASGQSQLAQAPNYNLFGIKGTYNGKSVSMATQEDLGNGTMYATQAGFRVYKNYEDCFNDYAILLKEGLTGDSNFYAGVWKTNAKTYQEATKFLTGRYATDTQYNQKLNELIETYNLTEYDKEVQGPPESSKGYAVPVDSYIISSPFGNRGGEFHRGLDMASLQGEPIHASKAGTVLKAEYHYSWGNYVVIEHEDGMTTLYAHQQQYIVRVGDKVTQGQIIGYVGSTGNSTGAHLHFELCRDSSLSQGKLVDPKIVLFED